MGCRMTCHGIHVYVCMDKIEVDTRSCEPRPYCFKRSSWTLDP